MKNHIVLVLGLALSGAVIAQEAPTLQGFDDVENIPGWEMVNNSVPLGENGWFQGVGDLFIAQQGDNTDSYIAANYRNTDIVDDGIAKTICSYLIMPDLGDLESISFYTRSRKASNNFDVYPDRLFLVYSPEGGVETGNCTDGFGDFTETLLVINPDLTQEGNAPDGYPLFGWEQFSSEVNGSGRLAFVYYVEDAGFYGSNSNYIGIDTVEWVPSEFLPAPDNAEKPFYIKPAIKIKKDL